MAVNGYTPIDAGACIDQDYFVDAYKSLTALEQAAKDGGGDVECVHISGSISGDTTTGEICTQLVSPADMPKQYINGDQVCCLIMSVTGNMENANTLLGTSVGGIRLPTNVFYFPYAGINTYVKCSGRTIESNEGRGSGVISAIIDPSTCDFSNGLEFCVDGFGLTIGILEKLEYTINWCGCLLCIQCPPLPLEDYYIPKLQNLACKKGLGDFAQIIHIINQMSAAFRCTGYTVECVVREDVTFDALIQGPLTNDSKWIGIACTVASWAGAPSGTTIRANVEMGCEGRAISCNSSSYVSRTTRAGSAEFVSVACGECNKGESIYFNSTPEINCATTSEEEEPQTGVVEVTGVSEMVFFVFKKLEADLPTIPQISSGCVFQDNADSIFEAAEKIHDAACQIKKPNKQARRFVASGGPGVHTEIVPPSPWPPPTPPPRPVPDPPPEKKWVILGSAQARVVYTDSSLFDSSVELWIVLFNYEIKCGGLPIHTSPWYTWPTAVYKNTLPVSFRVPICAQVSCEIDQNIEICMNFQYEQGPPPNAIDGVTEGIVLCIS